MALPLRREARSGHLGEARPGVGGGVGERVEECVDVRRMRKQTDAVLDEQLGEGGGRADGGVGDDQEGGRWVSVRRLPLGDAEDELVLNGDVHHRTCGREGRVV